MTYWFFWHIYYLSNEFKPKYINTDSVFCEKQKI